MVRHTRLRGYELEKIITYDEYDTHTNNCSRQKSKYLRNLLLTVNKNDHTDFIYTFHKNHFRLFPI